MNRILNFTSIVYSVRHRLINRAPSPIDPVNSRPKRSHCKVQVLYLIQNCYFCKEIISKRRKLATSECFFWCRSFHRCLLIFQTVKNPFLFHYPKHDPMNLTIILTFQQILIKYDIFAELISSVEPIRFWFVWKSK